MYVVPFDNMIPFARMALELRTFEMGLLFKSDTLTALPANEDLWQHLLEKNNVLVTSAPRLHNWLNAGFLDVASFSMVMVEQLLDHDGPDPFAKLLAFIAPDENGMPRVLSLTSTVAARRNDPEAEKVLRDHCMRIHANFYALPPTIDVATMPNNIALRPVVLDPAVTEVVPEQVAGLLSRDFLDDTVNANCVCFPAVARLSDACLWAAVKVLLTETHTRCRETKVQFTSIVFVDGDADREPAMQSLQSLELDWLWPSMLDRLHDADGDDERRPNTDCRDRLQHGTVNCFVAFANPGNLPKVELFIHVKPDRSKVFVSLHHRLRHCARYVAVCSTAQQMELLSQCVTDDCVRLAVIRRVAALPSFEWARLTATPWEAVRGLELPVPQPTRAVSFAPMSTEPDEIQLHDHNVDMDFGDDAPPPAATTTTSAVSQDTASAASRTDQPATERPRRESPESERRDRFRSEREAQRDYGRDRYNDRTLHHHRCTCMHSCAAGDDRRRGPRDVRDRHHDRRDARFERPRHEVSPPRDQRPPLCPGMPHYPMPFMPPYPMPFAAFPPSAYPPHMYPPLPLPPPQVHAHVPCIYQAHRTACAAPRRICSIRSIQLRACAPRTGAL